MKAIRDFTQFLNDAWEELKKVTWLSRPQMLASTWFVVVLVLIFAAYVGILDFVIGRAFRLFI